MKVEFENGNLPHGFYMGPSTLSVEADGETGLNVE